MKFTLSWLKTHLETDADLATIAKKLTDLGLEVESVEDRAEALKPFVVGYVIEAKQHPNADRLRVCQVDTGHGTVQVVCGAPNARTGMKGVFAPVGTQVPGTGLDLKAGNIRGEASNGMLCSARELGLGQDHDGIIELPDDAPVGASFVDYRKLGDPMIEIKITPDRADCLGVFGVARDLASAGFGKLKSLNEKPVKGNFKSPIQWRIDESAKSLVPYTAGRYFRGVKNGPSPQWLQDRLISIGLRPISALVDITNFVTFDLCRPLHVFDADKVKGNVVMRSAKIGETILALDGKTYNLEPGMVVIADDKGPQAIGGIMGGEVSGCSEATTNVFVEAALFDTTATAKTGRKLGILSDARYRNERGLDPQSEIWGMDVATHLIMEICGGEPSEITSAGALPAGTRDLTFNPARVLALGGIEVTPAKQKQILIDLGFKVVETGAENWAVTTPSFRADVEGEADLVEEIMRVHGFDHIPATSLPRTSAMPPVAVTLTQKRVQQTKRLLAIRGLNETVTFSFMPSGVASMFTSTNAFVPLANPISTDLDVMRPSILGNLLMAAERNAARGFSDVAMFEVGPTYLGETAKDQILAATGLRVGNTPRHWQVKSRALDAYDAKADAFAILSAFGVPVENLQLEAAAPMHYHPGQSAVLRLGPTILGQFGAIHPKVTQALGVKGAAVGFEVFLERLPSPRAKGTARAMLNASTLQPLERDFAFIVDAHVPAEKLVKAAKSADKALITEVKLFDIFQGGNLPESKKSLALSITLQPRDKTLTDAEIESLSAKVIAAVNKATGGELRK